MSNTHFGDDSFEKAAEAGYSMQKKTKKAVTGQVKQLAKDFLHSFTGHKEQSAKPRNFDALTDAHLAKFKKNFEAQDEQKMEELKHILFKHVNEESAQAVQARQQVERDRLRQMEEEEMRDQQEKAQEQGNGMVSAPQGKAKRNVMGSQAKKNSQSETRGGKSHF